MYYLYIISSSLENWNYIGITDNPEKRLKEHNAGKTRSTKARRPFKIVYIEEFPNKTSARKKEIFLKKNFKSRQELFNRISI